MMKNNRKKSISLLLLTGFLSLLLLTACPGYYDPASPGATDEETDTGETPETVATPVFSPAGGTYLGARGITITCATPGAVIYYTTDGSEPDNSGTAYTGEIPVKSAATLKAAALKSGMTGSAVAGAAYTITYTDGSKFTTSLYEDWLTITDFDESETDIAIPPSIDGYPVTWIGGSSFSNCNSLLSVVIPDSVTTIDGTAFYDSALLASVIIPDSVTTMGDGVFQACPSLESIRLPTSLTAVPVETFCDCASLESITIPITVTSIGDNAFNGCAALASIVIPGSVMSIGEQAFANCDLHEGITIPDSVTAIGGSAFYGSGITSVDLPSSVSVIEGDTFGCCASLESVTIPSSVTIIGNFAFEYCSLLASVTIPSSVTTIGYAAFTDCSALAEVIVNRTTPPSMASDGEVFTNNAGGRTIYVPSGTGDTYKTATGWSVYASSIEEQ